MVKRGEVWLARLDPTIGSEIQKTRPCLVVSPDEFNTILGRVVVVPMTTKGRPAPFRVPARFRSKDGLILPDQIRTVARQRLVTRLGKVSAGTLDAALRVLREMFGSD